MTARTAKVMTARNNADIMALVVWQATDSPTLTASAVLSVLTSYIVSSEYHSIRLPPTAGTTHTSEGIPNLQFPTDMTPPLLTGFLFKLTGPYITYIISYYWMKLKNYLEHRRYAQRCTIYTLIHRVMRTADRF